MYGLFTKTIAANPDPIAMAFTTSEGLQAYHEHNDLSCLTGNKTHIYGTFFIIIRDFDLG